MEDLAQQELSKVRNFLTDVSLEIKHHLTAMEDLAQQELSKVRNFLTDVSLEIKHHTGRWPALMDVHECLMLTSTVDEAVNLYMQWLHKHVEKQHYNWNW